MEDDTFEGANETLDDKPLFNIRKRKSTFRINITQKKPMTGAFESFNYDPVENDTLIQEDSWSSYKTVASKLALKWVIMLLVALVTAVTASSVDSTVRYITYMKYSCLVQFFDRTNFKMYQPLIFWIVMNVIPSFIGSLIVTYWEPSAAGGGVPLIKCYLNGIDVSRAFTFKVLVIKAISLASMNCGGLMTGKEGPMIHIGGAAAVIITTGQIRIFNREINLFLQDDEVRDMVAAGVACGISTAFGASIGGVIFTLEEGTSFWKQDMTWRMLVCTAISSFLSTAMVDIIYGHTIHKKHESMLNIGSLNFHHRLIEMPLFALVGILGGLSGALWNYLNLKIMMFRSLYFRHKWIRVTEVCVLAVCTSVFGFYMMSWFALCGSDTTQVVFITSAFCPEGEYNYIASMWVNTQPMKLYSLLHSANKTYSLDSLSIYTAIYYVMSLLTFGISAAVGMFIPALITGAALGRCFAMFVEQTFPFFEGLDHSKFALIGAVAHLGGIVRMTLSLTVIMMEASDNASFCLPIMGTLLFAKWTGDLFDEGIFTSIIEQSTLPFLYWDAPVFMNDMYIRDAMTMDPICLNEIDDVQFVVDVLQNTNHNGFPVVTDTKNERNGPRFGKLRGIILRSQIMALLEKKIFYDNAYVWQDKVKQRVYWKRAMRKSEQFDMNKLNLSKSDFEHFKLDFRPFMNCSPYSVIYTTSFPRTFRLFRTLGLRHLPVVNDNYEVIGLVTRQDIAKYRLVLRRCKMKLQLWGDREST